jgi:hypothetical protein
VRRLRGDSRFLARKGRGILATGKKDASLAGKQLGGKKSTPAQKSVAGSDLSQAKGKKKG